MISIGDKTTSFLHALVQGSVSIANKETVCTCAAEHYDFKDILQALDDCIFHVEMTIKKKKCGVTLNGFEAIVEQLGFNSDELCKELHNVMDLKHGARWINGNGATTILTISRVR
ncbi:Uncharacterized protein TCM_027117 [Theobroma cacao]|uniref:Uncharacterized protein n=1 Tax=Theobroma cacao TaxID=3641 RepID=A0A061G860_THECC|nr:Uncharacterized protein TCM_027117 [Theobroma cacao]